jgi:hypothetical protein
MEHYRFKKVPTFVQCLGTDLSVLARRGGVAATGPKTPVSSMTVVGYK